MEIQTTVCGIPCIASLVSDEEGGFEILDSRGRKAPWLTRKLTPTETNRINREIDEAESEGYFL